MTPGAVIMWSGPAARLVAHRLPLTLGRAHAFDDERISNEHASIAADDAQFIVDDLGSRNGTFLDGQLVANATCRPFTIVRGGHTLAMLVPDVTPYEGHGLTKRGSIYCGGSLAPACRILDASANAEEHVGIFGPINVGRALAHHYAEIVGGEHVVVDLNVTRLGTLDQKLAGKTPRTMILELERPLTLPDQPELEAWLETDVRIVTIARDLDAFRFMPKELTHRLTPRAVEVPPYRFDELPGTIGEAASACGATPHPTLVESALLHLRRLSEETLLRFVTATAKRCMSNGQTSVRGLHLDDYIEMDARMRNCVQ